MALADVPTLLEDPTWLDHPPLQEVVRQLEPAVDVDREYSVDTLVL